MHGDLSRHLHSPECNELIDLLEKCHKERYFGKWLGACTEIDVKTRRCLKLERLERQKANNEAAAVRIQKLHERMQKPAEKQ